MTPKAQPQQGILNYSTTVPDYKTAAEMQQMLATHGASRVMIEYDNAYPSGISFELPTPHGPRAFTLPCDVEAMHKTLQVQDAKGLLRTGAKHARASEDQARRVAWRVLKNWLAAQLALIETQMVDLTEVMLPYLVQSDGRTLYEAYRRSERALPGGPPGG